MLHETQVFVTFCDYAVFSYGGVDWQFLADEIHGLPSSGALPREGVTTFKATRIIESQPGYVRVKALDIKSSHQALPHV